VIAPYFADIQEAVGSEEYFGQFVVTKHFSDRPKVAVVSKFFRFSENILVYSETRGR